MGVLPLGIVHQVILAVGMNDADVVAVDLGSVLRLQEADGLLDGSDVQVVVAVLAGVLQSSARSNRAVAVLDDSTGIQNLAGNGVQGAASLRGDSLGGLNQDGGRRAWELGDC